MKFEWKLSDAIEQTGIQLMLQSAADKKDYTVYLKVFVLPGYFDLEEEEIARILKTYGMVEEFGANATMFYQILSAERGAPSPEFNDEPASILEYTGEMSFTHEFLVDRPTPDILKQFRHLSIAAERSIERNLGQAIVKWGQDRKERVPA